MKITRTQFINAMLQYGYEKGYSYDPYDCGMTWKQFKENTFRLDKNQTSQELWLPRLQPYLKEDNDFVIVKTD